MGNHNLENSLVEVIGDSGFFDLLSDAGEIILDDSIQEGLIKDIPIIGTIAKLYKTGVGIKGYIFVKKLTKFVTALKDIPSEKREEFSNKINKDKQLKKKVGEQLLLILDRLDDMDKPYLVAHAFEAHMRDLIDYETFHRLASAIDKTFLPDLKSLKSIKDYKRLSESAIINLVNSGILELASTPSINLGAKNNKYQITDLGKSLLNFVLKEIEST